MPSKPNDWRSKIGPGGEINLNDFQVGLTEEGKIMMPPLPEVANWFEDRGFAPTPDGRIQVSVYAVSRCYGGPEEGGWHYDWYDFTGVSERVPPAEVEAATARLAALFADDQPCYPISSVLSDGPEYHVVTEERAGQNQTTQKARYE